MCADDVIHGGGGRESRGRAGGGGGERGGGGGGAQLQSPSRPADVNEMYLGYYRVDEAAKLQVNVRMVLI